MKEKRLSFSSETSASAEAERNTVDGKYTDPEIGMEFLLVNGDCYEMGDNFGDGLGYERPVHEVCVDDFFIGKYLVTRAQWNAVVEKTPSKFTDCGGNFPVESVAWNDAQEFIHILNQRTGKTHRLPTEAEWEYAARSGGKNEKWAGTSNKSDLGDYAWYYNNSNFHAHAVGQKRPNGLGLYDMTGNLWEWTSDWYGPYAESPRDNPKGPISGRSRSLRGGYWGDLPRFIRVSNRIGVAPTVRAPGFGFRIVLPVQ